MELYQKQYLIRIIQEATGNNRYTDEQILEAISRDDLEQQWKNLADKNVGQLTDEEKLIVSVCIATGIGR